MKALPSTFLTLLSLTVACSAAIWSSSDYHCEINLPDGLPHTSEHWITAGSTEEGTLVGSKRVDGTGYIFLGYVDLSKRPNFHLNEKTIPELEKRFITDTTHHSVERIVVNGLPGFRVTGSRVYFGNHFALVIDMYEANNLIYQVVGMKQQSDSPLKDPNIRFCLNSFRLRK